MWQNPDIQLGWHAWVRPWPWAGRGQAVLPEEGQAPGIEGTCLVVQGSLDVKPHLARMSMEVHVALTQQVQIPEVPLLFDAPCLWPYLGQQDAKNIYPDWTAKESFWEARERKGRIITKLS